MDTQTRSRQRIIRRLVVWTGCVLAAGALVLALLVSIYGGYRHGWNWTGIVEDAHYHKKTLWDWLNLLIVPAVLALGGYLFTRTENRATQAAAEQRAQDEALQTYLDQLGQLLLDGDRPLRQSKAPVEIRRVPAR